MPSLLASVPEGVVAVVAVAEAVAGLPALAQVSSSVSRSSSSSVSSSRRRKVSKELSHLKTLLLCVQVSLPRDCLLDGGVLIRDVPLDECGSDAFRINQEIKREHL